MELLKQYASTSLIEEEENVKKILGVWHTGLSYTDKIGVFFDTFNTVKFTHLNLHTLHRL
jgi:hypothetical protein